MHYALCPHPLLALNASRNLPLVAGDAAQCALWTTMIAFHYGQPLAMLMIPCTMLGRVYFGCHWIGDTVVGASTGLLWAAIVHQSFSHACHMQGHPFGLAQPKAFSQSSWMSGEFCALP